MRSATKVIGAAALCFFLTPLHAELSEFQWQTPFERIEINLRADYTDLAEHPRTGASRVDVSGLGEQLRAEWGWRDHVSFFTSLGYNDTTQNITPARGQHRTRARGLIDPVFGVNVRLRIWGGSLHYGGSLDLAIEDQTVQTNGDSNNGSGGVQALPFVGYEYELGQNNIGGRVTYTRPIGSRNLLDRRNTPPFEQGTGGASLAVALFYERHAQNLVLGGALLVTGAQTTRTRANGVLYNDDNASTITALRAYARVDLPHQFTLLPLFEYSEYTAFNHALMRSGSRYDGGLALRYQF